MRYVHSILDVLDADAEATLWGTDNGNTLHISADNENTLCGSPIYMDGGWSPIAVGDLPTQDDDYETTDLYPTCRRCQQSL